jgi:tellurite methyltransferase
VKYGVQEWNPCRGVSPPRPLSSIEVGITGINKNLRQAVKLPKMQSFRSPMSSPISTENIPPHLERDWLAYYQAVQGRPPRETLLNALARFEAENAAPGFAVDLGCGEGRDTVELLRRGWRVLGIDGEADVIAQLHQRPGIALDELETRVERFEALTLPTGVDLINASFCLPFCPAAAFPQLWQTIVNALRPGGRFCGQLFGDRDSWATQLAITFQTAEQIQQLLRPFEIEWLEEEDHPGKTALGEDKHWHIFNIVVRK